MNMDFDTLRTLPSTTPEEFESIKQGILNMAKHDGGLGDDYTVAWHYNDIEIRDQGAEFVGLTAAQALSLLAWLEQEREALERFVEPSE